LWVDSASSQRALLYLSTNVSSANVPDLLVIDISRARDGVFREVATWNAPASLSADSRRRYPARLHSISVSADGRRGYAAFWGGGLQVLDTSQLAEGKTEPSIRLVTPDGGLKWGGPAHSAIPVPGRSLVLLSDEAQDACPWGWVRIADVSNEGRPSLAGEFRVDQNRRAGCEELRERRLANHSHTAHNPTVLSNLAFISWHSAGLQAIDLQDARRPQSAGSFVPEPLETVATEDPDLTGGVRGVAMWSYPIIKDGLIHVVDVRNGLYVLKYQGRWGDEVGTVKFAEGNSNLGDANQTPAPSASQPTPTPSSAIGTPHAARTADPAENRWLPVVLAGVGVVVLGVVIVVVLRRNRR
jgi:hypothetical protein